MSRRLSTHTATRRRTSTPRAPQARSVRAEDGSRVPASFYAKTDLRPVTLAGGHRAYHGRTYHGRHFHGRAYHGRHFHGRHFYGRVFKGRAFHGRAYHGRNVRSRATPIL